MDGDWTISHVKRAKFAGAPLFSGMSMVIFVAFAAAWIYFYRRAQF